MNKELKKILQQDFTKYKEELEREKTQVESRLAKINGQLEAINNIITIQNG